MSFERLGDSRWFDRKCLLFVLGILVPVHSLMLAWIAFRYSPTSDEVAHLAAGVRIWELGRFDLYQVNPPLVKAIAALPVVLDQPKLDWRSFSPNPGWRTEWTVGRDFIRANGTRSLTYFTMARWACIPFSLLGLVYCYRWSRELYGSLSGASAAGMWCFSPNILGNAALITPDVAAASLGLVSAYYYRKWLVRPDWSGATLAGIVLGLAQLAKMSWLLLYLVFPFLWIVHECVTRQVGTRYRSVVTHGAQLTLLLGVSLLVLNAEYGFDGSFRRLGDYDFLSQLLRGQTIQNSGNRFRGTSLEVIPVPLPKPFLQGLDLQRRDFEGGWRPMYSYLRGEHRLGGWWYYYAYGLCAKVPVGAWIIALVAVTAPHTRRLLTGRRTWLELFLLLFPPVALFAFISSQTGFSRYFRYVLPCFPFLFVWMSRFASPLIWRLRRATSMIGAAGLASLIVSSCVVYPHSLAFFNAFVGGPANGHVHLLDTNVDTGQELYFLKDWFEAHPDARPFRMTCSGIDPDVIGIDADPIPEDLDERRMHLQPGWYAISVNNLHGYDRATNPFRCFLDLKPVDRVGYSILIYHIERASP